MAKCPQCKKEVPSAAKFCSACGSALSATPPETGVTLPLEPMLETPPVRTAKRVSDGEVVARIIAIVIGGGLILYLGFSNFLSNALTPPLYSNIPNAFAGDFTALASTLLYLAPLALLYFGVVGRRNR